MALPALIPKIVGSWIGVSRLNLAWSPDEVNVEESASTLCVSVNPINTFATVSYTWIKDDVCHDGLALFACSSSGEVVTGGWTDSWHLNEEVMSLKGKSLSDQSLQASGVYLVEGYPEWGWRIQLEFVADELVLRMINIDPDGPEQWAVEARYTRA